MMVVKGDVYYSDSDSDDDDDVDRYVFLARQPAPPPPPAAGRLAEEDRGADFENDDGDDDGDATADEGEGEPERGGGRKRRKRPLGRREILDDAPPPPPKKKKKAGVEVIAPPLPQTRPSSGSWSETESDSAASPCGMRAGESGSEGSHGTKVHEHYPHPGRGGEAMNATKKKKRGACAKRTRGPGCKEEDGDRAVTAAAAVMAGVPPAATSGRFLCNLCERCFDSYQALGGHVLGHRKKAKIAIAAAAACLDVEDADGARDCNEEDGVVEANEVTTASSIALQLHKMAAAAARHGKANGRGAGRDAKIKAVDDVAEHRDEDVDSGGHDDANGDANFSNRSKDFANGGNSRSNGKTGIGAGIPNKKIVVGTCHEGDNNGDGNVSKTVYKCKVCGMECPTGCALGGHMRKHRKPPTLVGSDGDGRSSASPPTDDDCHIPLARMFGAETGLQRENKIGWV
ncbi:unnamed protein product [Urochloa humidicola]